MDRAELFHPPRSNDPVVAEAVRRLVEAYRPERIYLFGSAARGDAGPDSDYDFMVVVADDTPDELLRGTKGHAALRGVDIATDVLVWTAKNFDKQVHLRASLPGTILREGKLLYMEEDPVKTENAKEWLAKSARDLKLAEVLLSEELLDVEDALFHCQQAAEKALKAFLTWHDQPFRKTHDLGQQCVQIEPGLRELTARAERLTDYVWMFRYPGGPAAPALEDARGSLLLAREVMEAIHQRLALLS